jgi:hypothetical protein
VAGPRGGEPGGYRSVRREARRGRDRHAVILPGSAGLFPSPRPPPRRPPATRPRAAAPPPRPPAAPPAPPPRLRAPPPPRAPPWRPPPAPADAAPGRARAAARPPRRPPRSLGLSLVYQALQLVPIILDVCGQSSLVATACPLAPGGGKHLSFPPQGTAAPGEQIRAPLNGHGPHVQMSGGLLRSFSLCANIDMATLRPQILPQYGIP